jgi:hypothetical protein
MSYRKLLFVLSFVVLVLWGVQEASAIPPFPTGGTIKGPRKQAPNTDLICDLADPASDVQVTIFPSSLEPNAAPSFDLRGPVVCGEVPTGGTLAQVLPPGKGRFLLTQATPLDQFTPGFDFEQTGCPGEGCVRTWTFINGEDANVLYELKALDATARAFCQPVPSSGEECKVYFGLEEASDPAGEVIRFQAKTISQSGVLQEVPVNDMTWRLCHNLGFNAVQKFVVDAHVNSSTNNSSGGGAVPVNTGIFFNVNDPLIVSVDYKAPNLWNSGVNRATGVNNCDPFCRWSDANGQVRDLFARADDGPTPAQSSSAISGEPVGTLIGENAFAQGSQNNQGGLIAPIGTLVGKIDNTFFVLGTDFNGVAPATGTLELFYWDVNNHDNEGSVTVQVLKGQPISCQVDVDGKPVSTVAVTDIRGLRPVEVKGFPIFDLSSISAKLKVPYPLTAVACTAGDNEIEFEKNGAPIKPDTVLVNNMEVDVKAFVVLNTVHTSREKPSACDPTKKAADLNLLLDYTELRAAILSSFPNGKCTNGLATFNATFHDRAEPPAFYGGDFSVKLTNCPK